ncbi:hypothetical protein STEG23_010494, partial [Scotinomys teguina]
MFTSWLQPEKQNKEQMIYQLVLDQFLKIGHYKDELALKEKWESSGRNMERFMEGLTDECLKPPVMVHVSMQGQEAFFSENMSLEEVINLLKEQESARTSTQENPRTPLSISQNTLLATGQEDSEDIQNNPRNTSEVNDGVSSPGNKMDSLSIIQTSQFPEPKDRSASDGNPPNYRRTSQVTSRCSNKKTDTREMSHQVDNQIVIEGMGLYGGRNLSISSRFSNFVEYRFLKYDLMILWISSLSVVISPISFLILLIWMLSLCLLRKFHEVLRR